VNRRPDVAERHVQQGLATRRRILEAARELLEEHPWADVSIARVAQGAGVGRTAFYRHFDDRRALLNELFRELSDELEATPAAWKDTDDAEPEERLREALVALTEVFVVHGRLLNALAEEAARDADIANAYYRLGARLSAGVAERIARDVASGRSVLSDPSEVATALVWMNERYLRERFGRKPLGDPERAAAALAEVWLRSVYG